MGVDKLRLKDLLLQGFTTKEIGERFGLSKSTISYWITEYGYNKYSYHKRNKPYRFEKIDTKGKAYILGFLLADSGISEDGHVSVTLAIKDYRLVQIMCDFLNANFRRSLKFDRKKRIFPNASFSKKIPDIMKFIGGPNKEDRHYPRVRDDLERYLILGLFDADGCITWGRRKDRNRIWQKISFTSQLKILEGVQKFLINKLDISTTIRPKGLEKAYVLEFANRDHVLKFINYIYAIPEDSKSKLPFVMLQRKYLKAQALRLELGENGGNHHKDDNTVPSTQSVKV